MHTNRPSEITRLVKAFGYSLKGLKAGWLQPAFRTEIIVCLIALPMACVVAQTGVELALLIGSVLLVPIIELLNSAIEAAIDRISLEHHELSGRAKDMGSAAVLVGIINAAVIWFAVLW